MKKLLILVLILMFAAALPVSAQEADPNTQSDVPQPLAPDLLTRAGAALDTQDYEKAVRDLSLFILLNPTYSLAYYERAHGHIGLDDLDSALEDVSRALRFSGANDPVEYSAALYLLRGDIEAQQQKLDAALEDYTQSLDYQTTPDTLVSRGMVYAQQENFDAALEDLGSAIELDATNPVLYVYRGQINTANSDIQAAGADYLDFFNLIQPEPVESEELKTGEGVILQVDRAVVYHVPFRAEEGQFASARVDGESQNIDPLMVMVDPDGNAVAGDDDMGGNLSALLFNVPIPKDGEYMLVVGHSLGGYTGRVQVQLLVTDEPLE